VKAAGELFSKEGVEDTAVSDIVRRAGVAQGTFYLYFDSKDDVLNALAEIWSDEFVRAYEEVAARDDLNAVRKLELARQATLSPEEVKGPKGETLRHFHREEHHDVHDRVADETARRLRPVVARIISQGIGEGLFGTAFPDEAAWLILSASRALDDARFETGNVDARLEEAYADLVTKVLVSKVDFADAYRRAGRPAGPTSSA